MKVWTSRVLVGVVAGWLLPVSVVTAATHVVLVGDSYFDPNTLTIAPGDTVRWDNPRWSGEHNVTPDVGDWGSPQSISFVLDKTFTTEGDYPYYCSVHAVPGKPIGSVMNGIIRVQAGGPVFPVNAGLSDAWYNPDLAGQGFFITVWEQAKLVFLSWFTYDTTLAPNGATAVVGHPGQRWLTAQGPFSGDTASLTVYRSSGGIFSAAQPQPGTEAVGSIEVTWTGCNEAMLSYHLPAAGLDGEIPIERIVLDGVTLCEELSAQ